MNFQGGLDPEATQDATGMMSARLNPGWLLAAALMVLGIQNLLLWRFLNFAPFWSYPLAIGCFSAIALFMVKAASATVWRGPTLQTVLLLACASLTIFLLGGEGRIFYSNADWQVRDAVLHDLIVNPWPFVYLRSGTLELLRAPIGMFVIPAVFGKAFGFAAAEIALLVQNSLLLTLLLGLGSTLFARAQSRVIAFFVVVAFSGMDVIGQLQQSAVTGEAFPDHLERWAGSQFSSHITQAFWVPQHGMAGWFGALLFLLWRERRISIGQMYALLPMLMLLSPLGVMGTIPFAAAAGVAALWERQLRPCDFVLPALTTLLCVPAIFYLGAGGGSVGFHLLRLQPATYLLFEILEVLVFVLGVALVFRADRREARTLLLVTACLLAAPFGQLGEGMDFTMRVSIPALAILSVQVARALSRAPELGFSRRPARTLLFSALAVGSVTGMFEVVRAVYFQASPRVQCGLASLGHQVVELPRTSSNATYIAPVDAVPTLIRPTRALILRPDTDTACWDRPWKVARFG